MWLPRVRFFYSLLPTATNADGDDDAAAARDLLPQQIICYEMMSTYTTNIEMNRILFYVHTQITQKIKHFSRIT